MTTKKRYFSILLSLVLMLGMLPGLCLTAKAATLTSLSTSWTENSTISDNIEITGPVTITDDITLTIPKNKTLTVTGGINADGKTLTVSGKGTLIVSGDDAQGGDGLTGNIIVKGANVTVTGGNGSQGTAGSTGANGLNSDMVGGDGGQGGTGDNGGNGGSGVAGNVTVNSGSITVTGGNGGQGGTGGNGGDGGGSDEMGGGGGQGGTGGNGGNGGRGVTGNVTVTSGSITVTGGNGGQGGSGGQGGQGGFGDEGHGSPGGNGSAGTAGSEAQAVGGTITGSANESGDNSNWTAVSNGSSTKQYLMVTPSHTHSFTYSANSATATITATCSADGCPLPPSTEGGNDHVATLTIGKPTLETYGQTGTDISAEATIIDEKSIMGDAEVLYQTKNNGSYGTATETAPTDAGDHKASITLGEATASVEYTIAKADLTDVSVAQNGTLTYNGQAQTPQVTTAATAVNSQTVTFTYSTTQDGEYGEMPTVTDVSDGGTFYYKATAPNHNDATGSFTVTVNKADPIASAPTEVTATYGQTLADVTLTNPEGNTEGTWAWVDATTTSVGELGQNAFKANFTPTDTTNYNTVENVDVTVTVGKPNAVPATVTANNRTYDGTDKPLVTVTGEPTGGTMQYAIGTDATTAPTEGWSTSIPTATNAGT